MKLICLHMNINYSPSFLLKTCPFLIDFSLHLCWKLVVHICVGLFVHSLFCSIALFVYLNINTTLYWLLYWLLDVRECCSLPTLIFIFKSILAIPGPLYFYMEFQNQLVHFHKTFLLIEISLNHQINLGENSYLNNIGLSSA